jgi:hypothetical protein
MAKKARICYQLIPRCSRYAGWLSPRPLGLYHHFPGKRTMNRRIIILLEVEVLPALSMANVREMLRAVLPFGLS